MEVEQQEDEPEDEETLVASAEGDEPTADADTLSSDEEPVEA